jgi:dTDP-4-amino-4,6-dideoxygalactose transaminase
MTNSARPPRIYLSPPHVGPDERELLLDAFDSNWIAPLGPHVDAFERELEAVVQVPHAAALSSGTAALHLALELLGVGAGDRVLCASLTFAATANAIAYRGATPIFVDCDASWTIDPDLVIDEIRRLARVGKLPKAIIAVDLYGQCADYDRLRSIADPYEVPIIEDAAEALGSTYKGRPAGGLGVFGAFSFNGNKIITTSGGGMLVSEREDLIAKARFLATQARDPAPHYQHSHIGYNYRLSNLLAAVGRGQLAQLDDRVAARRANFAFYEELFAGCAGVTLMPEADYGTSNRWLTCITIDPTEARVVREDLRLAFEGQNIESRPVWKPMHLQPIFRDAHMVGGAVSNRLFEHGLALPSGSSLTDDDRARIAEVVEGTLR